MNEYPAVLVVEDDASMRTMLSLSLRRAGYPTLTASNGTEALDLLTTKPVGFMVTDGVLGGMDGFELSRRAKDIKPALRIAMHSAVFDGSDAPDCPIDRFFEKPVTVSGLVDWLKDVVGRS